MDNANQKFKREKYNKYNANKDWIFKHKYQPIEANRKYISNNFHSTYDSDSIDLQQNPNIPQSEFEEKDKEIQKNKQFEDETLKKIQEIKFLKKQIAEKEKENEYLKKKMYDLNKSILSHQKTKKELEEKISILEQKNEKKIEQIDDLNNTILSYKNEIEKSKNEIKKLKEDLLEKDKKIEDQTKKNENEINNLNDVISSYKKEIENLKIILSSNEDLLKNLKKYDIVKTINLNKGTSSEFMPKYDGKDPLKFYDIIVDINSIKGILTGWDILKNKKGSNKLKHLDENSIKIGVVGNGNKGKSFILSRISDIELPVGESIKTRGLSIKFPQLENHSKRKITLLDSAGQETPVLNNNKDNLSLKFGEIDKDNNELTKDEELTEKSRDKLLTEFFLQNYIVKYSDLLIIVVGILTFSEQKLINKIKKTFKDLNKKGQLVIIHNLQSYVTLDQVKNYINETLLKSSTFNLTEEFEVSKEMTTDKNEPQWSYFYESKVEPDTKHLIFAREKSQAGNFYNQMSIKYIYNILNTINEKEPLNLYKNIKDLFVELSNQILETSINVEDIENNENKINLKLDNIKNELKLKKCSIDELGINKFSSNGFEPKYCAYIYKNRLNIVCEVPGIIPEGSFKANANCENGKCIITIEGNKTNEIESIAKECKKIGVNKREFGKFIFTIRIDDVNIDVKSVKKDGQENGLVKFSYQIKENSSTVIF